MVKKKVAVVQKKVLCVVAVVPAEALVLQQVVGSQTLETVLGSWDILQVQNHQPPLLVVVQEPARLEPDQSPKANQEVLHEILALQACSSKSAELVEFAPNVPKPGLGSHVVQLQVMPQLV